MYEGFEQHTVDVGEARIAAVRGGSGPPVLLLHGFPQTRAMWHVLAPELARRHTVVAADLRGYGDSSRPPSGADHAGYSFRAMAADQVALMRSLGFERFAVVGHDRGARVAHRMALDHADAVERVAVLDILPTLHVYSTVDRELATSYYHWFFFVQPAPLPETLIGADPAYYLHTLLGGWGSGLGAFAPDALAEYERCFADADARHAMMEDYRAGASIDFEHDRADLHRRVDAPMLVLWGRAGWSGGRAMSSGCGGSGPQTYAGMRSTPGTSSSRKGVTKPSRSWPTSSPRPAIRKREVLSTPPNRSHAASVSFSCGRARVVRRVGD